MNSIDKKTKRKVFSYKYFLYDLIKITHIILVWIWLRPKKIYISEKAKKSHLKGGFLLSSNHTGYTDPIVLNCVFPFRRLFFVATKECFDTQIKNWFFTASLCIKIDRDDMGTKTFRLITDNLKEGHVVGIFPEGHVNQDANHLDAFHSGQVLMAHLAGVPILPVYRVRPAHWYGREKVIIGEPVNVKKELGDNPSMKDIEKLSVYLYEYEEKLANYREK